MGGADKGSHPLRNWGQVRAETRRKFTSLSPRLRVLRVTRLPWIRDTILRNRSFAVLHRSHPTPPPPRFRRLRGCDEIGSSDGPRAPRQGFPFPFLRAALSAFPRE